MKDRRDGGFTLLELMVTVLIIAILLAIAIPSFLGARSTASDRAAQSNVRNASTTALVYYADHQEFTADLTAMTAVDASLEYTSSLVDAAGHRVFVNVPPAGTYRAADTVYVATRSANGPCFWMRAVADKSVARFAKNDCSGAPAESDFATAW